MREQSFGKGNTKVTIYCIVDSVHTINCMKITDSLRSVLLEHNNWVKPNYYSTKVVSYTGFFTLLHPCLTNKPCLVQYIQKTMESMVVDENKVVVEEWPKKFSTIYKSNEKQVPKFHIETCLNKWGKMQVEVLSVHRTAYDTKYVKYLLGKVREKLQHGSFVPTGIHLLEGKEVLHNLLVAEQQVFVTNTTSFQLKGISTAEMYSIHGEQINSKELVLQGPGVHSFEKIYQTEYRGQWIVTVNIDRTQQLMIQSKISKRHRNKGGEKPNWLHTKLTKVLLSTSCQ